MDPSALEVYNSLHKHEESPSKLLEKKKELGLEIYDHFDAQDLFSSRLIITTHSRWKKEYDDEVDLGVRYY